MTKLNIFLGDYIYWSDWQKRSIERINKRTGNDRKTILSQRPDLMGLAAVSTNNIGTNYDNFSRFERIPAEGYFRSESCELK